MNLDLMANGSDSLTCCDLQCSNLYSKFKKKKIRKKSLYPIKTDLVLTVLGSNKGTAVPMFLGMVTAHPCDTTGGVRTICAKRVSAHQVESAFCYTPTLPVAVLLDRK